MLDHGNGEFSVYHHMQLGSVAVGPCNCSDLSGCGQPVTRGQLLGRVGNSGRSTGPHLHLQFQDAFAFSCDGEEEETLIGECIPFYVTNYRFPSNENGPAFLQLRSSIPSGTLLDIEPDDDPPIGIPPPVYGPGDVMEVEPNQTLAAAQRLAMPVEVSGQIWANDTGVFADAGDGIEDLYRIEIPTLDSIFFELVPGASSDLDLIVYDGTLRAIQPSRAKTPANGQAMVLPLPAGIYHLFVSQYDPAASRTSVPYTLVVEPFGDSLVGLIGELPPEVVCHPVYLSAMRLSVWWARILLTGEYRGGAAWLLCDLGRRTDGCLAGGTTQPRPDGEDWIVDCVTQREVHTAVFRLIASIYDAGPARSAEAGMAGTPRAGGHGSAADRVPPAHSVPGSTLPFLVRAASQGVGTQTLSTSSRSIHIHR